MRHGTVLCWKQFLVATDQRCLLWLKFCLFVLGSNEELQWRGDFISGTCAVWLIAPKQLVNSDWFGGFFSAAEKDDKRQKDC